MFDILMFLFQNYMDSSVKLRADEATVIFELERYGFDRFEIDRALDWLDGLNQFQQNVHTVSLQAIRHYLPSERERLGIEGQGLLLKLEQMNILDPVTREIVVDRIMALDHWEVDLGRIRWVVLMALFNQPEKHPALKVFQEMVLADVIGKRH